MGTHKELSEEYHQLLEEYEVAVANYNVFVHSDSAELINTTLSSEYVELIRATNDLNSFVMGLIAKAAE